jgi:hypothetical protein
MRIPLDASPQRRTGKWHAVSRGLEIIAIDLSIVEIKSIIG